MTDYSNAQINTPSFENISVKVENEGKTQIYKGKEYRLATYLGARIIQKTNGRLWINKIIYPITSQKQ